MPWDLPERVYVPTYTTFDGVALSAVGSTKPSPSVSISSFRLAVARVRQVHRDGLNQIVGREVPPLYRYRAESCHGVLSIQGRARDPAWRNSRAPAASDNDMKLQGKVALITG